MISRSQGSLAATVCVLAFGACSDPVQHSDLRPSGPPEVLAVLASDDTSGDGVVETATFCKPGDDKRPALVPSVPGGPVQICPDDVAKGADKVTDTVPVGWYVRIQFDELLNPAVEDLNPIPDSGGLFEGSFARTQPVTLTCDNVNVPYEGYYDPSGNNIAWPLGPSIFVAPLDTSTVATGAQCSVTIKADVIADKDGEHVPSAQLGPYTFEIAALDLVAASPAPPKDKTMPATIKPTVPAVFSFNAPVELSSLDAAEVTILEVASCAATTGTAHVAKIVINPNDKSGQSFAVSDTDAAAGEAWLHAKTYIITFNAGAEVQDLAGGTASLPEAGDLTLCFKTAA